MGNYYNYDRKNKKIGFVIRIIIFLLIILFIYGCYNFEFLKNNKYISLAKDKISETVTTITSSTKQGLSSLVENYEPDEEDYSVYEVTDTQNKYFYNQLDEPSKIIYAEMLGNLDRIKKGEDNIKISSKLSLFIGEDGSSALVMDSFQNAWDAFRNDNMDIFYIDGSKMSLVVKSTKKGKKTTYEFFLTKAEGCSNYLLEGFSTAEDVDNANKFIQESEKEILDSITEKNDYYKIMKVHNWIVDNIQYNKQESTHNVNIYGALKNRKVVCEGYARLFKSLMDKLNIPCVMISGVGINEKGSESHAWNYVYLKGNWYAMDVTWDDPVIIGNGTVGKDVQYRYFLKGSNSFFKNHTEEGKVAQKGMTFKYPEISKTDYVVEKQ